MNTMNVSFFIEKVGHGILNTFLLPAADHFVSTGARPRRSLATNH